MLQLLLLCSAAAFSAGVACRRGGAARAPIAMQEERRFEVCQGRYCSKKGAKRTLALFEELGADVPGVLVEVADMGHTDHGCFDECTMGPNVRVGGDGPQTDNGPFPACKIVNGVKGEEAVSALLPPLP